MPFGLTNAPATFQSIMNRMLEYYLRKFVLVFMDDILIYSSTLEEHIKHLTLVFQTLADNQFFIKASKCETAKQQLEYLGHLISGSGVATEPSKVAVVSSWPRPQTVKQLRGFLGLTGYYRRFIKQYGVISQPLTQLLKKNVQFLWTSVEQKAFDTLKQALIQAPVLALPDFNKVFTMETDASDLGMGAVLMQGHPISFLSKSFYDKNKGLSTYEKECMAVLLAVEKWRPYLQHKEFILKTDNRSLLFLTEQRATTKLQQKAMLKLMDLNFKIQYKQGHTNKAADALSRLSESDQEISAIYVGQPSWLQVLQEGYLQDVEATEKLTQLSLQSTPLNGYNLVDGIFKYKNRIWVGNNQLAQRHILQALHSSAIGGHSCINATYQRVKALFAWPQLKASVVEYVQACQVCQQAKPEHVKLPGLLQPLPVPTQAWQSVSLDFIEGLPKSNSYDVLLIVIDRFSKYAHFIPLSHPYSALQVAQVYMTNVYKLHGLPQSIISDRDIVFTAKLWQELFKLSDTQLQMSSAYHPQSDGQTKRLNQCVEAFLRCTVHSCPRLWSKWIALAEFWYNTTFQSAIGRTPFEVLYGQKPRHLGIVDPQQATMPDLEKWLTERNMLTSLIQQQLA